MEVNVQDISDDSSFGSLDAIRQSMVLGLQADHVVILKGEVGEVVNHFRTVPAIDAYLQRNFGRKI